MESAMELKKTVNEINLRDKESVTQAMDIIVTSTIYCFRARSFFEDRCDSTTVDKLITQQHELLDELLHIVQLLMETHLFLEDGHKSYYNERFLMFEAKNKALMDKTMLLRSAIKVMMDKTMLFRSAIDALMRDK